MTRTLLFVFLIQFFSFACASTEESQVIPIQAEQVAPSRIPEPTIQALLGLGVLALLSRRPRR